MATSTTQTATGNPEIDGLLSGYKWSGTVTYSFPDSASDYPAQPNTQYGSNEPTAAGFHQLTASEQAAANAAMTLIMSYTNVNIVYAGTDGADIRLASSSAANPTSYAYYPANSTNGEGGDVWIGTAYNYDLAQPGNYYYLTFIHELGHSFGLKHSQEKGGVANVAVPAAHDGLEYSVMSYRSYIGGPTTGYTNEEYGYPTTYMANDILALQTMYGADFTTHAENTVYSWDPLTGQEFINGVGQLIPGGGTGGAAANRIFMTVWDGNGIDTYDLSNYTNAVNIDLTPGGYTITSTTQLAYLGNGNYAHGNVYNAYLYNNDARSYIDNAIGGSGNDTILGNAIDNQLDGGIGNDAINGAAGNDTLIGGDGNDTLTGGAGLDKYIETVGGGADIVTDFTEGVDTIDLTAFAAFHSLADVLAAATQVGANTVIDLGGSSITLNNTNMNTLTDADFVFTPVAVGDPPTDIALSGPATVAEGTAIGTVVGTLSASDPDQGDTFTYKLTSNPGGLFAINGSNLVVAAGIDFEAGSSRVVTVKVTDSGGNSYTEDFTISITDVAPSLPTDTNATANKVTEGAANGTLVGVTAAATDVNGGAVAYSLTDNANGRFAINATTGVVTVLDTSQIKAVDGTYSITVSASDGTLASIQTFVIAVAQPVGVTINGTALSETIDATHAPRGQPLPTAYGDTILGNGGNDTIRSYGGDDTINGGSGADKMYGGDGNDTYVVDNTSDVVDETNTGGVDKVQSSITFSLSDATHAKGAIENLTLLGTSAINGTGNGLDNIITGNSAGNTLAGLGGADTLDGQGGTDTVTYAASTAGVNVSLATGIGTGGDAQGDTLLNIENLTGSNFDDTIEGNAGTNKLTGGLNTVVGDTVSYEHASGAITISLALTTAQSTGGAGSDTLSGFENVIGSGFNDKLTGSSVANVITGLAGDDTINAGGGNDTLIGGAGNDTLTGSTGADAFVFNLVSDGVDTITDFTHASDFLQISAAGFGGNLQAGGVASLVTVSDVALASSAGTDGYFIFVNSGPGAGSVYYDADGGPADDAVLFAKLQATATLSASDFHLV